MIYFVFIHFDLNTKISRNYASLLNELVKFQPEMMKLINDQIEYGLNDNFEFVRLPYSKKDYPGKGKSYSNGESNLYFSILLPRERFGLKKSLQSLKSYAPKELFGQMESTEVHVSFRK